MIIIDKERTCLVQQEDKCYLIYPNLTKVQAKGVESDNMRLLITTYDMYSLSLEEFKTVLNNYKKTNIIEMDVEGREIIENFGKWNKDEIAEQYNFSFLDYYIFERRTIY